MPEYQDLFLDIIYSFLVQVPDCYVRRKNPACVEELQQSIL
jgi:hypothetical protein